MRDQVHELCGRLQRQFESAPYDFTSYEIEAQVRVFNALRDQIQGSLSIDRPDAVPPYSSADHACRIRLETGFNHYKHDIILFKEGSTATSYEDVDLIIEIKIGWGITEDHIRSDQVRKDLEILSEHKEKAYLLFFLGNRFTSMTEEQRKIYTEGIGWQSDKFNAPSGHIIYILRDRLLINGRHSA